MALKKVSTKPGHISETFAFDTGSPEPENVRNLIAKENFGLSDPPQLISPP